MTSKEESTNLATATEAAPPIVFTSSTLTPKKIILTMMKIGVAKTKEPIHIQFLLSWMAGMFVGFGCLLAIVAAGGLTGSTHGVNGEVLYAIGKANPSIPKIVTGMVFPVALLLIVFTGGELFTGNTMIFTLDVLQRKVRMHHLVQSWVVSYFGNLCGCLCSMYFFGYHGMLFHDDPWHSYVKAVAVAKISKPFGTTLIKGIGANWCVCLAVWFGLAGDNLIDKIFGLWWPVATFAIIGFEHSIANMFFIPMGIMLGADVTVSDFITKNLIPATIGNAIGGGFFVGALEWIIYREHLSKEAPAITTEPGRDRPNPTEKKVTAASRHSPSVVASGINHVVTHAFHRRHGNNSQL